MRWRKDGLWSEARLQKLPTSGFFCVKGRFQAVVRWLRFENDALEAERKKEREETGQKVRAKAKFSKEPTNTHEVEKSTCDITYTVIIRAVVRE